MDPSLVVSILGESTGQGVFDCWGSVEIGAVWGRARGTPVLNLLKNRFSSLALTRLLPCCCMSLIESSDKMHQSPHRFDVIQLEFGLQLLSVYIFKPDQSHHGMSFWTCSGFLSILHVCIQKVQSFIVSAMPTGRVQSRLIRVKSPLMVMKASGCLHRRSATVTCIMSHAAAPADVVKDSYSGKEYGQILSVKSSMSSEQRHSFTVTCPGSFIN